MDRVQQISERMNNMGTGGLKVAGGMNFTPTEYKADPNAGKQWLQLSKIADWAKAKSEEDERDISERIMMQYGDKLPAKMKELYPQLNKATIRGLKRREGLNIQNFVSTQINQRAAKGEFNNVNGMQQAFDKAMKEEMNSRALQYGWNRDDEDYLDGLANGYQKTQISLTNTYLSSQAEKTEAQQSQQFTQMNSDLFKHSDLMWQGQTVQPFVNNLQNMFNGGEITSTQFRQYAQSGITQAINSEGGTVFLSKLADQKIQIEGFNGTYKEYFGEEQWNNFIASADNATIKMTQKYTTDVRNQLELINNMEDLGQASVQLNGLQAQLNVRFPHEHANALREEVSNMQQILLRKQAAQRQAMLKETEQIKQSIDDVGVFRKVMKLATESKNVSMNPASYGLDEKRWAVAGKRYIQDIEESEVLNQEQKAKLLTDALYADKDKGPIVEYMNGVMTRGYGELMGRISLGKPFDPNNMPKDFQNALGYLKANPTTMALKFPKEVAQLSAYLEAKDWGITDEQYISGTRIINEYSTVEKDLAKTEWLKAMTADSTRGFSYLPKGLQDAAYVNYMALKGAMGGGPANQVVDQALKSTKEYINRITWKYDANKTTGKYNQDVYGAVPKTFLQLDTNPKTAEIGGALLSSIIDEHRQRLGKNVSITMRYESISDGIKIWSSNGPPTFISKQDLTDMYTDYLDFEAHKEDAKWQEAFKKAESVKGYSTSGIVNNPKAAIFMHTLKKLASGG